MELSRDLVQARLDVLIGREVTHRRITGNTIILYFNGKPGDARVLTLRIDPSWRYAKSGHWHLGSGDVPWEPSDGESPDDFQTRFDAISNRCDGLLHSVLETITLAPDSCDLELTFSHNQRLCSFSGYTEEEAWVFTDRVAGKVVWANPNGFSIESHLLPEN